MKTYVLTLSQFFQNKHKRSGEPDTENKQNNEKHGKRY